MSNTLARRLLEDRCCNSISRFCIDFREGSGSLPGRLILSMQGSQCKKIVFIWNQTYEHTSAKWQRSGSQGGQYEDRCLQGCCAV
jgi:hypothetical protein